MKLTNTQSGVKEDFTPPQDGPIKLWVCGPTVYDTPHIGNARPVIVFDILYRMLIHLYGDVVYARNYTDVDDKIITRARERGISIKLLCDEMIVEYERVMGALNILEPSVKPRATDNIPEMANMIERLLDSNHAYIAEGHVLFDTTTYPEGVLSGQSSGRGHARISEASYKRRQSDFVLWKPADGEVGWASPQGIEGLGRPAWHIECSALIAKHLGETIDIHGGGQDLIFPHHEAECAQSECAYGVPLARYWVHNAMVLADGKKMAKSDRNFVTVSDVLDRYSGQVLKFAMLMTHYRHPFDFRWSRLDDAASTLGRIMGRAAGSGVVDPRFLDALSDDLNTPLALQILHTMPLENISPSLAFLGFYPEVRADMPADVLAIFEERLTARASKDWVRSDALRKILTEHGIVVEDTTNNTSWKWADNVY